jgi:RNA polymerase sigma-70 factor (ECF subfamily)
MRIGATSGAAYDGPFAMKDRPTEMVPGGSAFPTTQWSRILRARDPSSPEYRRGLAQILQQYWRPVYVYIRRAWGKSNEDAKDLAQGFFVEVLENDLVSKYAPQRGRFRTFLKAALKNFLADQARSASRQKRGGGKAAIPLDGDLMALDEIATAPGDQSPEAVFDRTWANELMAGALVDAEKMLRAEGREGAWKTLELYDLAPPPGESLGYKEVAQRLGRPEAAVKADLAYARQRLRQCLVDRVRVYVEGDKDLFAELKEILSL